jgi:tetratricopeptide (TPR) repeat protein
MRAGSSWNLKMLEYAMPLLSSSRYDILICMQPLLASFTAAAQAMGHHPASVRQFAEWSNRSMIKAGVKLTCIDGPPPYRSAAADAKTSACAIAALAEWRAIGQSITMQNPGDGVCPTYDGMRAAARINLLEMQQEERETLVVIAKKLLGMMTLCPPTNTPMELFLDGTWVEHDVLFSQRRCWMRPADGAVRTRFFSFSDDATREAIAALKRHALIEIQVDNTDQLALHQLMALAVRAELENEVIGSRPGVEDVIALLAARYGLDDEEDINAEEFVVMRLIGDAAEHAVAQVLELVGDADVLVQRWACSMLLRLARVQEIVTSDAADMDRLLVAASGCLQRLRGVGCTELDNLEWRLQLYKATVSGVKGDHDSRLAMLRALEEAHAATPRVKLMSALLNNIGSALDAKGENDKALEYHTRALDVFLERLGPRHPDVATSLGCIGGALDAKGEHDKAVEYLTRALDIYVERFGPRHPEVAKSLNNIGNALDAKCEHSKAVEYYTHALDIRLERLGPRHPHVAGSLNNIGNSLRAKGEHDQAVEFYTRALDIRLERLGPRHPHVAGSLSNIGNVLHDKGEHAQAVEYYTRALDIELETLGAHPDTALSFFNLSFPLMRLHQSAVAADCIICCLHMLVSNPAFESQLVVRMKDSACRLHVIVQAQRCSDALPYLPALDRIASQAEDGVGVCLYITAAAEVYRQCDMPSRAAATMRRAAAMMRRVDCSSMRAKFYDAGLDLHPDGLEISALQLERHVQSEAQIGVHDLEPPRTPAHAPPLPALPLPVRLLAC